MDRGIKDCIERFNDASLYGDIDGVARCLHDKVVFLAPDLKHFITGKEACLETIRSYQQMAKTLHFRVTELTLLQDIITPVVLMKYDVGYEMKDKSFSEKGTEFLMLTKLNKDWKIIWRALLKVEPVA